MSEEFLNSNTFLCGVIEGFYGRPWTQKQRKELFQRMQNMGMNSYIYAPKDDAKHRQMWREMYTVEESVEMQALINAARDKNIEFIYAISPGLDIAFSSEKDVKTLKRKLEHMQQMGCRSFALLFDDIEPQLSAVDRDKFLTYAHAQVSVTNEVYQHLSSPGCFIFCPTEYCATRAVPDVTRSSYLNLIGSKLLSGIDIIWTGSKVIPRDITLESIHELARVLCRPPLIWDNLHANDYDQKRLFMGPYDGRSVKLIPYLRGVMTNPNCEFEANFLAMHTLAQWSRCSLESGVNENPSAGVLNNIDADTEQDQVNGPESTSLLTMNTASQQMTNGSLSSKTYNARRALLCALQEWLSIIQQCKDITGMDYTPFVGSVPPGTQCTQQKKKPQHRNNRVRSRKSVAKGLLAVAKGSFPPAAAQEVVRVTQSAVTLPNSNSQNAPTTLSELDLTSQLSSSPPRNFPQTSSSPTQFGETPVDQVVHLCSLPNMQAMQDDPLMARSALHAAAVVAQVAVEEENIKSIQASMPLIQVCMDSSNGESVPAAMTSLPQTNPNVLHTQLEEIDSNETCPSQSTDTYKDTVVTGLENEFKTDGVNTANTTCCSSITSTLVVPVTSIDSTVAVATQQAAYLLEQSDEAQLLQLQNDPSLFPAPLSSSPAVFTLTSGAPSQTGESVPPVEAFSFSGEAPGGNAIHSIVSGLSNSGSLEDLTGGTINNGQPTMVLLQPASSTPNLSVVLGTASPNLALISSVNNGGVVPMETDCEKELNQLEQMECQSIELSVTPQVGSDDDCSQHSFNYKTAQTQCVTTIHNQNEASGDEDAQSGSEAGPPSSLIPLVSLPTLACTLDDLCLLVDLFYLPYEFGPKAQLILDLLHWLRVNANLAQGAPSNAPGLSFTLEEQAQELNISTSDLMKLRQEWTQRATNFRQLVDAVRILCERLSALPNRAFLFDVYPYVWDVRALLCMLETYITWLGRYPIPLTSCIILRRLLTWGTPGYKPTFMSGEHEPWMFRGGFISELQRMLPLEGSADLFPSRMPPPVLPPNSEQSPVLKSSSPSNNIPSPTSTPSPSNKNPSFSSYTNETTPLVHMMQVRPYYSESGRDRIAVYQLCRRITWLRIHLDFAQQAGVHVNLSTAVEDCFLKHQVPELPADRYLEGFLGLSPQYCFVVEDVHGDICGFAMAATNAGEWFQACQQHVYPRLRDKYPLAESTPMQLDEDMSSIGSNCSMPSGSGNAVGSNTDIHAMDTGAATFGSSSTNLVDEETYSYSVLQSMKSYFHNNELPQGYTPVRSTMSSPSEMSPSILERTYPAIIHVDFLPTKEIMLWHDDVAKRMLACLLAALRTSGITGVHCRLNRNEGSHIAFYRRYRFEVIEVDGCDLGNEIILGRTI